MTSAALKNYIKQRTLKTSFSAALAALVILTLHPAYANDEVIDGYELPSMFEDDISTPIPDQSGGRPPQAQVPKQAPKPVKAKAPPSAQITNKAAGIEYEKAFTPLSNDANTVPKAKKSKTVKVLRPLARPRDNITTDSVNTATIPAKEMPQVQAETKAPIADSVTKEEIYKLSEKLYERTSLAVLPIARPAKIAARSKKAPQHNMPAVPPVTVAAMPLAQPSFLTQQGEVKSISRTMPLENATSGISPVKNISNISVGLDLEDITAPDALPLDVTKVIENADPAVEPQTDNAEHTAKQFDTTQAHQATLFFAFSETELADEMKQEIDTGILKTLEDKDDIRIEILSYAQAVDDTPSSARRVSLARALALRTYLLSKKIDSHRIDVRALGNNTNMLPIDRIDVELIN